MLKRFLKKTFSLKGLTYALEYSSIIFAAYLILLPIYPWIRYSLRFDNQKNIEASQDLDMVADRTEKIMGALPGSEIAGKDEEMNSSLTAGNAKAQTKNAGNRLIITKIGVNAPIVEAASSEYGLNRGAWRIPDSSTPPDGGNTVITGHRFKYLPPSNLTFYLFHKITKGDIVSVVWDNKYYYYRINKTQVIDDNDVSILLPSEKPMITLFTCHPIYSTAQRLVLTGELIGE